MSDAAKPESKGGGNKKLILIVVVAVLVSVGAAVGATMMLMGGKDKEVAAKKHDAEDEGDEESGDEADEDAAAEGEEGEKAGPVYVSLEPAFVVNFQDAKKRTKFLKAEISVVTGSPKAQEALTTHMPAVRNSLVLLLSRQVFEELATNEGKEKLRAEALAAVQGVVKEQASKKAAKAVKDLYFSSLVMQ
ncbi:MAG: flagellar basal body-associated protein FliL [Gammaproteobacteria bacterium]